jgi:hypothetical protein
MSQFQNWARGLALVFMTASLMAGTSVNAQVSAGGLPHRQEAATPDVGPYGLVTRDALSGGVRAPHQGDNDLGVMSLAEFKAKFPNRGEAAFRDILNENREECAETGEWIRESISIMAEARNEDAELVSIRQDLVSLGEAQNHASWLRRGFGVISGALFCALGAGPKYCGAAVGSLLGSEAMGTASDKANKINRHQSDLNARQSRLQLRATLLTMRMNIGWAKMTSWYCNKYHVDATLGFAD